MLRSCCNAPSDLSKDGQACESDKSKKEIDQFRLLRFWMEVAPIIVKYKWETFLTRGDDEAKERRLERLHEETAPKARQIAETFGGIFVKAGQGISSRPELAPDPFVKELRKLQSEVPASSWDSVRQSVEAELGGKVDQIFDSFKQDPLGCASIGQAHLATWQGRQIVVKVQYPGIAAKMRSDLANITMLCKIAKPEALELISSMCEQFERELDYDLERQALACLHEGISASSEFASRVVVPAPVSELSRGKVIGMEFLPGPKLESALQERLEALGINLGGASLKEFMMKQMQQAQNKSSDTNAASQDGANGDTKPGNGFALASSSRAGCIASCGRGMVKLCGFDRSMRMAKKASAAKLWLKYRSSGIAPPRDFGEILRTVVRVHGYQMFFCQLFNADPHPGNILLLPDGRIGLIDFGFCVKLDKAEKQHLAKLFILLAESPSYGVSAEADQRIMETALSCGVRTENNSREALSQFPRFAFNKFEPKWLERGYIQGIMSKDKVNDYPMFLLLAGRCAALLRGLCFGLQENISCAEEWAPYARMWLQENT